MSVAQTQFLPGPGPVAKHEFYYEGSDLLYPGYLVCLNADYGTITAVDGTRTCRVEKPAIGNIKHFAGVVAEGKPSYQGPCRLPLVVPAQFTQMCNIFCDVSATQEVTDITLKAGSYIGGKLGEGRVIARAAQTVDRDTTNGLIQCQFFGLSREDRLTEGLSNSRTAVMLPTAAIWDNFPLAQMRADPFLGSLFETDFRRGDEIPAGTGGRGLFEDTTGEVAPLGTSVIGEMVWFSSVDNEAAEVQWANCLIDVDGAKWAFEIRVKAQNITTDVACWFVGLLEGQLLVGDVWADNGATMTDGDWIGFAKLSTDTEEVDSVYRLQGQTLNKHADSIAVIEANTYVTLGLYFNGTDIAQYVNGVATGTNILGTGDMDQADFPLALELCPTVALKGLDAADIDLTVDWIRCAQAPAS